MSKKRTVYIDVIRCFAMFMVLFNHSVSAGFMAFSNYEPGTVKQFVYLMNSIFVKCGVPLFFMISGSLLLGKEETIGQVLKRFLRFAVTLVFASAITYLWSWKIGGYYDKASLKEFLKILYTGRHATAYWYLYTYLMYILMLPFLRAIVKNLTIKEANYILVIYLVLKLMTVADYLIWKGAYTHNGFINVFFTLDYVLFPAAGYAIEHIYNKYYTKKIIILLCCVSIVIIALEAGLTNYRCGLTDLWGEADCQLFFNTFVLIPSATLMILTKELFKKMNTDSFWGKLFTVCGSATFGIYLFERIWRHTTDFVYFGLKERIDPLVACWVWLLSAAILGGIVSLILKKIPIIKKIV